MFFDGFRAAPGWMALVTGMLVLGSIAGTCYPLGYRLLADGALDDNSGELIGGVAVVALLLGLAWVLVGIGATEAMALSDRIAVFRTRRMIELISGVPTLEHLERADYLAHVERLNSGRRQLASAPRQILSNVSQVARIIALLVLLGSVSPWLLLLPVTAVPPLIADRLAKKITRKSEDAVAADRRLAGMIFDISANAGAAGELRSYGLAPHLKSLHASLTRSLDSSAAREARKVLAVQSAGWLLYAAGLMAAIAFTVIRASDGAVSLGTVLMTVSLIRRSRAQLASTASVSAGMIATQQVGAHRVRDAGADQGQHAERERGVGGHGRAPAVRRGLAGVDRQVDPDRHHHPAQPDQQRQRQPQALTQLAHVGVAARLQAGDQEEERHEPGVHPFLQVSRQTRAAHPDRQLGFPERRVPGPVDVRPGQRGQRAASSTAALPVSVRRNWRSGVSCRAHAVRSEKREAGNRAQFTAEFSPVAARGRRTWPPARPGTARRARSAGCRRCRSPRWPGPPRARPAGGARPRRPGR